MTQETSSGATTGDFVKMTVAGITLDPTNNMPIVILKDVENKVAIPIWIGLVEASAIATEIEGVELARPMTHDLLKSVLETLGGKLDHIAVSDLRDNTFYALLFIERGDEMLKIDSRPSDAIALALRTRSDLFVAQKVIDNSQQLDAEALKSILKKGGTAEGTEEAAADDEKSKDRWAEILENLKPEDFGKYKM
jgi:uncharacterized protein